MSKRAKAGIFFGLVAAFLSLISLGAFAHVRGTLADVLLVVGNMGSEDRFDHRAIGDTINLASRLDCALFIERCKQYMDQPPAHWDGAVLLVAA